MKELPTGKQSFDQIINGNYVYVDKTDLIYKLISLDKTYFLSRPRRFGKSLLLSTMEHIFLGHRELFKGLWIDDPKARTESEPISEYDWLIHPVVHLDMSVTKKTSRVELEQSIMEQLNQIADSYDITIIGKSPVTLFSSLIYRLSKSDKRVVILIDEYDAPIVDNIEDDDLAVEMRKSLQEFYAVLKSSESNIRFVFITGVSKFTHASIFSKLNNLNDITLEPYYANICGFTDNDLTNYFIEHISDSLITLKQKRILTTEVTITNLISLIKYWYDGYSWDGINRVFNPYSVLSFFEKKKFGYFWFASGAPIYIYKSVKQHKFYFNLCNNMELVYYENNIDIGSFNLIPLMFQTGYLTVSEVKYEDEIETFVLTFPNHELRIAFFTGLMANEFSFVQPSTFKKLVNRLTKALITKNSEEAKKYFESLLTSIPYNIYLSSENYYLNIFILTLAIIGQPLEIHQLTGDDIVDAVFDMPGSDLLVIEMKHIKLPEKPKKVLDGVSVSISDESPLVMEPIPTKKELTIINQLLDEGVEKSFNQINDKKYDIKYQGTGRKITKVAMVVCKRMYVRVVFEDTIA
ncbi:MAG: AAA family ATPase [Deltaproteobacteria bacterium]|jgi:hypothetical protein|nr:AAA family ATPase [Deltaproteobacteria bacterium]